MENYKFKCKFYQNLVAKAKETTTYLRKTEYRNATNLKVIFILLYIEFTEQRLLKFMAPLQKTMTVKIPVVDDNIRSTIGQAVVKKEMQEWDKFLYKLLGKTITVQQISLDSVVLMKDLPPPTTIMDLKHMIYIFDYVTKTLYKTATNEPYNLASIKDEYLDVVDLKPYFDDYKETNKPDRVDIIEMKKKVDDFWTYYSYISRIQNLTKQPLKCGGRSKNIKGTST